ncbi:hypothetical protein [Streptosporangium jomthongense]|uniref:Uncharacterized protein n=2 Tax=Streptosporangium TaxID=2000 RepID=A0ABV8F8B5_9ACTN
MPPSSAQDDYAHAALRHYRDAVYLHDDKRLPNADHHYGFAVECALKSLLLRYLNATMIDARGRPSHYPWTVDTGGNHTRHGHLPGIWSDVATLLRGRTGSTLGAVLTSSAPFAS